MTRSLGLLLALAACTPQSTTEPRDRQAPIVLQSSPVQDARSVDPQAPILVTFAPTDCLDCVACDLDAATLLNRVTLDPAPVTPPRVLFNPQACTVSILAVNGLLPEKSYTLTLKAGVADVYANARTAPYELKFMTGQLKDPEDPTPGAPKFLGSWPPDGDDRLGAKSPIILFFNEEVQGEVKATAGGAAFKPRPMPESYALEIEPVGAWPTGGLSLSFTSIVDVAGAPVAGPLNLTFNVPPGADGVAPRFEGGLETVTEVDGRLALGWSLAKDDTVDDPEARYLVYAADKGSAIDYLVPAFVTAPGAAGAIIAKAEGKQVFAVRAQDLAGNVDENIVTKEQP